jgi:alpha-D-ribose 1-methylphosphonate 5-triphosphate diphosphatase PhnM
MDKIERVSYILLRLRSEQIQPDDSDMLLLQAYIDSKISLIDLLGHARQFATEAHYREWMSNAAHLDGDDMETADAEDQFLIEVEALMKRKHLGGKM